MLRQEDSLQLSTLLPVSPLTSNLPCSADSLSDASREKQTHHPGPHFSSHLRRANSAWASVLPGEAPPQGGGILLPVRGGPSPWAPGSSLLASSRSSLHQLPPLTVHCPCFLPLGTFQATYKRLHSPTDSPGVHPHAVNNSSCQSPHCPPGSDQI